MSQCVPALEHEEVKQMVQQECLDPAILLAQMAPRASPEATACLPPGSAVRGQVGSRTIGSQGKLYHSFLRDRWPGP